MQSLMREPFQREETSLVTDAHFPASAVNKPQNMAARNVSVIRLASQQLLPIFLFFFFSPCLFRFEMLRFPKKTWTVFKFWYKHHQSVHEYMSEITVLF